MIHASLIFKTRPSAPEQSERNVVRPSIWVSLVQAACIRKCETCRVGLRIGLNLSSNREKRKSLFPPPNGPSLAAECKRDNGNSLIVLWGTEGYRCQRRDDVIKVNQRRGMETGNSRNHPGTASHLLCNPENKQANPPPCSKYKDQFTSSGCLRTNVFTA